MSKTVPNGLRLSVSGYEREGFLKKRIENSLRRNTALLMAFVCSACLCFPAFGAAAETGPGITAEAGAVTLIPDVTPSMCRADYWEGRTESLYLTPGQIAEQNRNILNTEAAKMNDLEALPEQYNGDAVKAGMLNELSVFPKNHYLNGAPVPDSYYQAIVENISGAATSEAMPTRYGYCVTTTVMKGYPYAEYLSDTQDDTEWDDFVSSGIRVNEPLAVYFSTADGRFTYVRSTCCSGWAPTEDLAVCKDKAEWEAFLKPEKFLVVTGEKVYLEASADFPEASQKLLTMGTVLPLSSGETGSVTNRMPWFNYVVKLPCRNADGSFYTREALVSMNRDVHTGFLPLTEKNILEQAFKSLGNRYGWGGMLNAQDCSSYIRDVYKCFGLDLPRNTTWQSAMPAERTELASLSDAEKTDAIRKLPPGSILFFKGHEMMYLGERNGKLYVISDVSSLVLPGDTSGTKLRARSVIVNSLSMMRANGTSWLFSLYCGVVPWKCRK
jgi:cell wall-associated NlpC family hydrolase